MPVGGATAPSAAPAAALGDSDIKQIRAAIRGKYAEVSRSAQGKFVYPTGLQGAELLGYDPALLEKCPPALVDSFCGVGNPFSIEPIAAGEAVLDIGCGGGFDLAMARWLTGSGGRVCGIDLTQAMIDRAQANLTQAGINDVDIQHVEEEIIPFADNSFDAVISNGVINLSPCKERMFREIYRVLKPGGRVQFADVILEGELPSSLVGSLEAWSQ